MGLFSEIRDLFSSSDEEDSKRKEDMEKIRDEVKKEGGKVSEGSKGRSGKDKDRPMPWNAEEKVEEGSREGLRSPAPGKTSEKDSEGEEPMKPPETPPEQEDISDTKQEESQDRYEKREFSDEETLDVPAEKPEVTDTSKKGDNEGDVTPDFLVGEDPSDIKVPEAPELKEIEVPDIDKGPLFIRVEKFRKVERTLADMKRITDDMEAGIGGLRNGLDEDRKIRSELEETINRLEASLGSAKDLMSP